MVVSGLDDEYTVCEDTLLCAFDYAIGRKSYVVANVVRDLTENAELMSRQGRNHVIANIRKHQSNDELGYEVDRQHWIRLFNYLVEINEEAL